MSSQRFTASDIKQAGDDFHLCRTGGILRHCSCFSNIYRTPWNDKCQHLQLCSVLDEYNGSIEGAAAESEIWLQRYLPRREQQRQPRNRRDQSLLSSQLCVGRIVELCELAEAGGDDDGKDSSSCAQKEFSVRLDDSSSSCGRGAWILSVDELSFDCAHH